MPSPITYYDGEAKLAAVLVPGPRSHDTTAWRLHAPLLPASAMSAEAGLVARTRVGPTRYVGVSSWTDDGLFEQVLKGALLLGGEAGQR